MPTKIPTLDQLKKEKIHMFERDFCFTLTSKELNLINTATTDRELDVRVRQVINNHFGD